MRARKNTRQNNSINLLSLGEAYTAEDGEGLEQRVRSFRAEAVREFSRCMPDDYCCKLQMSNSVDRSQCNSEWPMMKCAGSNSWALSFKSGFAILQLMAELIPLLASRKHSRSAIRWQRVHVFWMSAAETVPVTSKSDQ